MRRNRNCPWKISLPKNSPPPPLLVSKSVNLHLKWSLAASIMVDSWMLQHQLPITALHSVELLLLLTPAQALSIALAPPPWNTAAVGGYCREKLDCWQQLFLGRAVRGWIYSDPPPFIDHNKQHTVMTTIHSENHTFLEKSLTAASLPKSYLQRL